MEESLPFKYQTQQCSPMLLASISNVLDLAGISSVLWGKWALSLHGAPYLDPDIQFVIRDEDLHRAYRVLLERGFLACPKGNGCINDPEAGSLRRYDHPPPMHLHLCDGESLCLQRKSEMLWTVPSFEALPFKENPEARIILASDRYCLPHFDLKTLKGAYSDSMPPVRVPSWHCLLEAYALLAEKEYDEDEVEGGTLACYWFVMMLKLAKTQDPSVCPFKILAAQEKADAQPQDFENIIINAFDSTHRLNLEYIDPRCRRFCRATWRQNVNIELGNELKAVRQAIKESREDM